MSLNPFPGSGSATPQQQRNQPAHQLEVIQLEYRHIAAAARLAAETLRRAHTLDPRLPLVNDAERSLALAWERRLADLSFAGFGTLAAGTLVATLGVSYRRLPEGSSEVVWTPSASGWMSQALCAIAPGWEWTDVLPPLYAAAASWLNTHHIALHFASAPIADGDVIAAWRSLGFHPQGIFALLRADRLTQLRARPIPHGIHLRAAKRADAPSLAMLLAESHRFHAALPGSFYSAEDGDRYYPELVRHELRDPHGEPHYIAAVEHRHMLGFASGSIRELMPGDLSRFTQPIPLAYVDEVCVTEAARGRGIAAALVAALLPWFEAHGPLPIGLHFIVNNPISSVVWPRLGFRPLDLRMQGGPDPSRLALPEEVSP